MSVPNAFPVSVFVTGINVTDYCPYQYMQIDDLLHDVSKFSFKLENPPLTPAKSDTVTVVAHTAGFPIVFSGYIVDIKDYKRDNGITSEYDIEAGDRKLRLQKSVLAPFTYTGLDSDILAALLADTYPDLSSIMDFSTGVDSFADDLSLDINDDSLADAIEDLAQQAGADYSFDRGLNSQAIGFDPSLDTIGYQASITSPAPLWTSDDVTGGNPTGGNPSGYCYLATGLTPASPSARLVNFDLYMRPTDKTVGVTEVTFDYWINCPLATTHSIVFRVGLNPADQHAIIATNDGAWHSVTVSTDFTTPFSGSPSYLLTFWVRLVAPLDSPYEVRFDNIVITTDEPFADGAGEDELDWDDFPDLPDFDLDIDLSDEFAFDIDLETGDWDDFNSVTVIGGTEDIAIDETYHGNGVELHFDLYAPVKDIAVYKNTASDNSPSWSALDVGEWGVDELGVGGIDVLYSAEYHFLVFETAPLNLEKAVRVTGTISKPIRVRVESVTEGEPVLATTLYSDKVSSEAEALTLGFNALEKRNAIKRLKFKTHHPYLKVGQIIQVTDTERGLLENILINRVHIEWLGASGHALFEVECGESSGNSLDVLIANTDKRSRPKAEPIPMATSVFSLLVDEDDEALLDEDNQFLYEDA